MINESTALDELSARGRRARDLGLAALHEPANPVLDRLVTEAASRLGVAGVNVSLLTDRQVTVAGQGLDGARAEPGSQSGFEDSICVNALRSDEPLVIPDTRADARVSSIPMVDNGPVRSYLGSTIRTDEGVVAVLCVYDSHPRQWSESDLAVLDALAGDVRTELLRLAAQSAG